ncbi:MAG: response regulator [Myxococcales bacterium]|nr:response regulator [Myxococcales bacterium]MCB9754902.1 response regulator [Myxococcales bacterium]
MTAHAAPEVLQHYRDSSFRALARWCLGIFATICCIRGSMLLSEPTPRGYVDMALQSATALSLLVSVMLARRGAFSTAKPILLAAIATDMGITALVLEDYLRFAPGLVLTVLPVIVGMIEAPTRARRWGLGVAALWVATASLRVALVPSQDGTTTAIPFIVVPALIMTVTTLLVHRTTRYLVRVIDEIEDARKLELINAQLNEARKRTEAVSEAKSAFLANMSHELRTPLNAIIGYSERLTGRARQGGESTVELDHIQYAGRHLLRVINDILDISKIEAGRMDLFVETFEIAPLLESVASTVGPLVAKNSNTLVLDAAGARGPMTTDLVKLRQCLFNLLSNAAKFTQRGTIELRASRAREGGREQLVFRVRDTGIGMDEEQLRRMFEPFVQADASVTRKYGGTGLGLAITAQYCEMMGGAITAESTPGEGSTFTMRLPASVDVSALASGATPPLGSSRPRGRAPTVLVVDDDHASLENLEEVLEDAGYQPLTASSGRQALSMARKHRPDLILLDLILPDMDGWAVLSALKTDEKLAQIPVVMLSASDDSQHGLVMGASDYLTKPYDPEALLVTLARHAHRGGSDVLVVEDDPASRALLAGMLEDLNWPHREAQNGREALERVAEKIPQLIFLDLMMPEMDGFSFLEELRANPPWLKIPVVVVTAKELTSEERKFLRGRVVSIQRKGSFTADDLVCELDRLLGVDDDLSANDREASLTAIAI